MRHRRCCVMAGACFFMPEKGARTVGRRFMGAGKYAILKGNRTFCEGAAVIYEISLFFRYAA